MKPYSLIFAVNVSTVLTDSISDMLSFTSKYFMQKDYFTRLLKIIYESGSFSLTWKISLRW